MIKVEVCYSTANNTWNIMYGEICIFYGDILAVEHWLLVNKERYVEEY